MLESIEKLRESLKDCTNKAGVEPNRFDTYWITAKACDILIDEVEAEIAERYMELPVDADGVPWHIGDVTENGNTVNAITFDRIGAHFTSTLNDIDPSIHTHAKPRTVEDVLEELLDEPDWEQSPDTYDDIKRRMIARYAAELRELLGSDAE